jgi:glycosyltransferase involved in cell wall biosynthesis
MREDRVIELSIVIPCRNERETITATVQEAAAAIVELGIPAEIIVADNASNDGSGDLAASAGARVVHVDTPGYGSALKSGIEAAQGTFVVMGDADGSYDFGESGRLVAAMRDGSALVMGCRFPRWGGAIEKGAMPWSHRNFGNPALSLLARMLFPVAIHDVYCGLRGFVKGHYDQLNMEQRDMTFAVEMVVKFSLAGMLVSEVPIRLRKDARIHTRPHLRTLQDGWATLRLLLSYWYQARKGALVVRCDQ